jgi:hypothetical protein
MKFREQKSQHQRLRQLVSISLLLAVIGLVASPSISAQTDDPIVLGETYQLETATGTLLVNYPEGWLAEGVGPDNIPYVALHNRVIEDTSLPTMLVQIVVTQTTDLPITFDLGADNLSSAYFDAFRNVRLEEERGTYGDVVEVQFGNEETTYDGALMMLLETDSGPLLEAETKISIGLSVELDDSTLLIVEFQAGDDIFDATLPLWLAMIDTLIWEDVGLGNTAVREAYTSLENMEALQQRYLEIQDQQGGSNSNLQGVDRGDSYSLHASEREITVPRAVGWTENSREDDSVIRFENPDDASTFFELRWLEDDRMSIPMAVILQQIALEGSYEVFDVAIFSMDTMPCVGVSYRLENRQVGIRFGLALPNNGGVLEIVFQSQASNWLTLQGLLFGVLPELGIEDAPYNFPFLLQAYQSLQNPSIGN